MTKQEQNLRQLFDGFEELLFEVKAGSSTEMLESAKTWAKSFAKSASDPQLNEHPLPVLILGGLAGIGKTHVAGRLAEAILLGSNPKLFDAPSHNQPKSPIVRVLNLRWTDFIELGQSLTENPMQSLNATELAAELKKVWGFIPEWALSLLTGEDVAKARETAWGDSWPRFENYVLIVHDVEEAFAHGENALWNASIAKLRGLNEALPSLGEQRQSGPTISQLGLVLTSRIEVYKEGLVSTVSQIQELDALDETTKREKYKELVKDSLGLAPLLSGLEGCKLSMMLLCGLTHQEAVDYCSSDPFWKRFWNPRGKVFDKIESQARVAYTECIGHLLAGMGCLESTRKSSKTPSYFYTPLGLDLAAVESGLQSNDDLDAEFYVPELMLLPLRDAVAEDDTFMQVYALAFFRVWDERGESGEEERRWKSILDALLLLLMVIGTRSRSSGWHQSELINLIGADVDLASPPSSDVAARAAVGGAVGLAPPPSSTGAERAAAVGELSKNEPPRWDSILVLDHQDRLLDPYRSFFELDILRSEDVASKTLRGELNSATGCMWLPRHPTVRDFGIKLTLLFRAAEEDSRVLARPDKTLEKDDVKRFWDDLFERWKELRELVINNRKGKFSEDTFSDENAAFEELGLRMLLGDRAEARLLADGMDCPGAAWFPSLLTAQYASLLKVYGPCFDDSEAPPSNCYELFDLTSPDIYDEEVRFGFNADATLSACVFGERAYQDLDLWGEAQKLSEGVRRLPVEGTYSGDVRIKRHREFAQVLYALLCGENDGDYIGTLFALDEIQSTDCAVIVATETSRAIACMSMGGLGQTMSSWKNVATHLNHIKEGRDDDLGALDPADKNWIKYEVLCASANLAVAEARAVQPYSLNLEQGMLVSELAVAQEGARGQVYALAEIAYVLAQEAMPKTVKNAGTGSIPTHVEEALNAAKRCAKRFAGDPWIHCVVDVLDALVMWAFSKQTEVDKNRVIGELDKGIMWSERTLTEDGEPHYTELIFRVNKAMIQCSVDELLKYFAMFDICGDAHWFPRVFGFLVNNEELELPMTFKADDPVQALVIQMIVDAVRASREATDRETRAEGCKNMYLAIQCFQQILLVTRRSAEFPYETITGITARLLRACFDAIMKCTDTRSETLEKAATDSNFMMWQSNVDWDELAKRIHKGRDIGWGAEPSGLAALATTGQAAWVRPPILIPELAVYRSMPAYLSRL